MGREKKTNNEKRDKVFLIRNVASEKYGGGEIYQLKLAKKLTEAGFSPVIITNSNKLLKQAKKEGYLVLVPPYSKNQNWSGYRNVFLPVYQLFQIKLKRWYEEMINLYEPKVVNIQSRDDMIAGTLAANKFNVKVLWTDHADFKNWVLWNVNNKYKNIIGKKIIKLSRNVNKVIFISQKIKEETIRMITPCRIENAIVINNGVEDEWDKYKDIKANPMSFVFLGRVVKEKGIRELMNGFKMVIEKYPKAILNIYGSEEADYRDMCLGYKNIVFHGATDKPLKALAESQIFVLPSYMEGLSLSLLDAAMMKKVIIATDVGGNREVVKDNESGLLVPPGDEKELAKKMNYALENKKKALGLAKKVREIYKERYDFDEIFAKKMLPLYNGEKEKE